MSFTCKDHGWQHLLNPCPACSPQVITSTDIILNDHPENGTRNIICDLESQLAIAMQRIEALRKSLVCHDPFVTKWVYEPCNDCPACNGLKYDDKAAEVNRGPR